MSEPSLSERDVCTKLITPAVERAGWDIQGQVREEVSLTAGRVMVRGRLVARGTARQFRRCPETELVLGRKLGGFAIAAEPRRRTEAVLGIANACSSTGRDSRSAIPRSVGSADRDVVWATVV
jgi:hypothetical protein